MSKVVIFHNEVPNVTQKDFTWNTMVRFCWLQLKLTTTATVGSRAVYFELLDLASVRRFYQPLTTTTVTENLVRGVHAGMSTTRGTSFNFGGDVRSMFVPIPHPIYIRAGWILRIKEVNAIDPLDDMVISGAVELL